MRMQNVEMEFVTFDAQDVIATSGLPDTAGNGIYSTGTILYNYNTAAGTVVFNNGGNKIIESNKLWFFKADGDSRADGCYDNGNSQGKIDYNYIDATGNNAFDLLKKWLSQNVSQ